MILLPDKNHAQVLDFGLKGITVNSLNIYGGTIYAGTDSGVYTTQMIPLKSDWTNIGLSDKRVKVIYPHQFGAIGIAVTAGIAPVWGSGDSALIYCSSNFGTNWAVTDTGIDREEMPSIIAIDGFPSPMICGETYAGGYGKLYRRKIGGWWEKVFDIGIGALNIVKIDEFNRVWIGGETGIFAPYIAKSGDKGDTWETFYPNMGGDNACYSFCFDPTDSNTIYAGMEGAVIKSTDGGITWNNTGLNSTPYYFNALAFDPFRRAIFAGGTTSNNEWGFFYSLDDGSIWTAVDSPIDAAGISSFTFIQTMLPEVNWLLIGTLGNGVYSFNLPLTETVEETNLHKSFELYQNYPNPFNPTTTIRFKIAGTNRVKVKIYDMLGKEIALLIDEELETGEHSILFNGDKLSTGVYYYRIETPGFTRTKSMHLIR